MPKKNGLELSKELKEIDKDIMIGVISGYDYFDYMREAIKIGVDDYILKPTTKNDILEMTKRLIDKAEIIKKNKKIEKITVEASKSSDKEQMDNILEENVFKKEFNLTYFAEKLHLSPGYLSILFKKEYGIPFQDYVLKKRMEKAALLLLSTDKKNYIISSEIGFESVYYFNIKFKKFFNLTPKEYKKGKK
ncbi:transcriptional regulator ExsA [Oceanivirga miroungae]|uniref:Transcriptional regulator ExsA n=2 Tax=Oceanivirga miroungae TaxID=1130046 RepID=A0A6I8MB32_9FUSO|nr:transcriptional regulator ExsA [Oceanivirga miroungae]